MEVTAIATLANAATRLRFLAMERSLRAVGCDLPLLAIPYDDRLFDLPAGARWWVIPEVLDWLRAENAHPMMAKYQCLTIGGCQFVDTDVVFLRDPRETLAPHSGFIASCGQWRDPFNAVNPVSLKFFRRHSTLWQKDVFNAGQFACDRALFTPAELKRRATSAEFSGACFKHPSDPFLVNDQTGLNLLVLASGVPFVNLNLPPSRMASTWAGDYPGAYEERWAPPVERPYLIHWAGIDMLSPRPIHALFHQYLTSAERQEWDRLAAEGGRRARERRRSPRVAAARLKKAAATFWRSL